MRRIRRPAPMLGAMQEADSLAWIILARAPDLDVGRLSAALEVIETPQAFWTASTSLLRRAAVAQSTQDYLHSDAARPQAIERRWLQEPRHHIVPFNHARYPRLLRAIDAPPVVLHVSGNLDALDDPQLAIVGSRNPTPQGRDTAFDFAEYLAERGLGITSGAADGVFL